MPSNSYAVFAALPSGRAFDAIGRSQPKVASRVACRGLHFVCRLPSELTMTAAVRHTTRSRASHGGNGHPCPLQRRPWGSSPLRRFSLMGSLLPTSSPPGMLQPDPGFEVRMISVHPLPGTRPKASALESSVACRRNPMEARDALPHTLHTPRRLIPRRQPYRLTTALALLPFTASCSRHPSKKAPSPRPRTPNPHAHSSPFDMGASKRAVSNNGPAPPASISSHCSTTTRSAWASP